VARTRREERGYSVRTGREVGDPENSQGSAGSKDVCPKRKGKGKIVPLMRGKKDNLEVLNLPAVWGRTSGPKENGSSGERKKGKRPEGFAGGGEKGRVLLSDGSGRCHLR